MSGGGSREEERRKLADIINHWNANRLDLFEISPPTEVSHGDAARCPSPPPRPGRGCCEVMPCDPSPPPGQPPGALRPRPSPRPHGGEAAGAAPPTRASILAEHRPRPLPR